MSTTKSSSTGKLPGAGKNKSLQNAKLLELTHNLSERVKELNCLYGISRLYENGNATIDDILRGVVGLIPPAWQYPDITCVRIKLEDRDIKTANFRKTAWCQFQAIMVNGKKFGTIEVCYLLEKPESDEGPFLKEERNLIRVIAERLGNMIEHKTAENNLKTLYQREQELYKKLQLEMQFRADLTRKLIHELKTPLTSLVASSQLLYEETHEKKLERLAQHIWNGANNLNNRVDELHDVTRGEMGKLKLVLKKVDIINLVQSLIEETGALARQYGISIELEINKSLPEIEADPERIRQIVFNLINNACKYAREGKKITIKILKRSGAILIEVKDYGPGIPASRQANLFEPGYQITDSGSTTGGLGIGLALCKMLVELHGGRIWVDSTVGKGSSFFFTMPVKSKRQ